MITVYTVMTLGALVLAAVPISATAIGRHDDARNTALQAPEPEEEVPA